MLEHACLMEIIDSTAITKEDLQFRLSIDEDYCVGMDFESVVDFYAWYEAKVSPMKFGVKDTYTFMVTIYPYDKSKVTERVRWTFSGRQLFYLVNGIIDRIWEKVEKRKRLTAMWREITIDCDMKLYKLMKEARRG